MSARDYLPEHKASIQLDHASRQFLIAWASRNPYGAKEGMKGLRSAVEELGYELRPIMTPQEAHDACLARRVAEDNPLPSAGHMNPANVQVEDAS